MLPGTERVLSTHVEPAEGGSTGVSLMSNNTGANTSDYSVKTDGTNISKGGGLGDIELLGQEPPIEIGNRVWNDANGDGIQNANESGIGNVDIWLYADFNNDGKPDGASGNLANLSALAGNTGTGVAWNTPSNVLTQNGTSTTASLSSGNPLSQTLQITNFGFSIPTSSTITGVTARIRRQADNASGVLDSTLKLVIGGLRTGNNKASGIAWTTSLSDFVYGGTTDLWGTNLTAAQVNATNFGLSLKVRNTSGANRIASVDVVEITVSYTNILGVTTTSTASGKVGEYYFNNSNVVDGDPNTSGNQTGLRPNKTYLMRIASFGTGSDWDTTANNNNGGANASGALAGFQLTTAHRLGSGALDLSDNDATIVNKVPQVSFTTSAFGVNIHTYDFGFDQMASIGDLVWRDDNKNGTQESGEPGVSGITVSLYQNGPDGNPGTSDDIPFGTAVTDAYGKYLFDNLPASSGTSSYYNVGFTLPANYQFTSSNTPGDNGNNTNSDANLYSGRTAGYNLSGGEYDATVDAGIIFNNPNQASVGDYVWYDINADGNQNTGEPGVSGVTVTLLNSAGTTAIATTITDANGYYLFTNVTPGTYRVGFSLPPGTAFTTNSGAVSGTTNSDATTTTGPNFGKTSTFTVNAGDAIRYVDAGIKSQPTSLNALGDFVWYDNNRDGIQDAGEPGIQGVKVRLLNSSGVAIDSTTTNAYGYYIFNNLTPGNYRVHFVKPSGLVITGQNQGSLGSADSDGNPTTGQTVLYTLIAGEKNMTVDCGLYGTSAANAVGALGDYVWNDLDRDGIQDSGEPGVAGITVILYNSSNVKLDTTSTNSSGYYLFPNLTPGNYYVEFLNIPLEYQFTLANQGGNDNTDSDADVFTGKTAQVSVTAGNTNSSLDAGLIQGAPAGLGSLGNRVWYDLPVTAGGTNGNGIQDAGELGVANVTVELLDGNGNSIDPDGAGSLTKTTTITNALGEYMFTGLNAGNYMVEFSNLPANYTLTTQNAGSNDELDSDGGTLSAGKSRTGVYSLAQGEDNLTVDLGIKPAANTNTLGNFVWFDVDADGTQDANEKGVPGVMVQLYASNGDPVGCATDNIATDFGSLSDNDGTINFNGDWTVSGGSTGIFTNTMRVYGNVGIATRNITMPAYGADNVTISLTLAHTGLSGTENFVIEYNNGTSWINLGTYTSADIVGTKTFTSATVPGLLNMTGIRFDEGSVGYANADFVSISNLNISLTENCSPITTTTNKDGEYLFTGLADGSYGVGFSNIPAGFNFTTQSATNDATGSDAGILSGLTTTVALGSSNRNDRSLDAGLVSTRAALGNFVWFDADKDGLQDNNESGVSGVTVTLYDGTGNTVLATAITDQNGLYLFPNLTANTYVVGFTTIPYMDFTTANASTESLGTDSDADQVTGKTASVTLAASEINLNIDAGLYLGLPAQIGNYVWMDTNKNGIQENGENGVPGALIVLYNSSNVAISSAFTNGSGYYQITDVPAGSNYYLIFTANLPNFSTSATPGTNPAWTTQDVGTNATQSLSSGTESDTDSDITKSGANAGKTSAFTVVPGNNFPNMDAGVINGNQFSPVPVTWLTFKAFLVNKNEDVQLDWSTASEINNSHFEVQRSIDGKNFETIAFVNSKAINGQSNSILNYTQLDPTVKLLNSDILYYRIKQVDYDGKFDFTQIEVIRLKDFATLRVYPNPTQDEVHISMNQISESENIEISVFDINGKLVLGKTIDNIYNNSLNTSLDIRQLENGIYTITIFDGINTNSLKIIKK
jgi:protocatechuate 3,4-dioxygenase beta subunit